MKALSEIKSYLFSDNRKLKSRMFMSFGASFAFVMTFYISPIIEIFIANTMFFDYTVPQVIVPVLLFSLVVFAVLFGFSFLLKGRIFNWYVSAITGVSLAAYIQSLFMNSCVGVLDGTEVHWDEYLVQAIIGIVVWIVIIAAFFVVHKFSKNIWKYAVGFVAVLLCVMQLASTVGVFFISEIDEKNNITATRDGEFSLSDKHNVIILALDSFDIKFAEEVMKNNPEYFDEFDGFTWYKNTISHYSRTFPSVAYLFTGKDTFYKSDYDDAMAEAWEGNDFLKDMKDGGYGVRIYQHQKYVNPDSEYMAKYCDNYISVEPVIDNVKLIQKLVKLSLYRTSPVVLKPKFETDTEEVNSAYGLSSDKRLSLTDYAFYERLTANGISDHNTSDRKGTFSYYLFKGCHGPYVFDENCQRTKEEVGVNEAVRGALTNVSEYLRKLKELGVYDKATIIVTADHGRTGAYEELDEQRVISMFYKPVGAKGEIKEDYSPQQILNVRATVLKEMGLDYSAYGTPFDEVDENAEIKRYFYMSGASADGSVREENLITYEVTGDANDFSNWKIVDEFPIEYPFLQG